MANSGFNIVKNTIPRGLRLSERDILGKGKVAVTRGLEVIRKHVVGTGSSDFPVISGRLKGSIQGNPLVPGDDVFSVKQVRGKPVMQGILGTNVVYARRVEFGFQGADSLGREYNQSGRFYFTKGFKASQIELKSVVLATLKIPKNKSYT